MRTVLLACVVLAGCGGKKDDKNQPAAKVEGADPKPADKPADPPPEKPVDKPAEPTPEELAHGFCHVTGSGAVTFDQKTPHTGGSMLNVFQWHTEEMRGKMGYDKEGMILNCLGADVRLNIMTGGGKAFPTKPGSYKFGKGGTARVLGSVSHVAAKKGLSILADDGTLEITAFDDKHIAGKGELTAKTLPDKGEVKITFDFDMKCRDLSGCVK